MGPISFLMMSMAFAFMSWENASPLSDLANRPSSVAAFSKAAVLYQPAVPVRFSVPGFSKKSPRVLAPDENAGTMRDASPYPVDDPMTRTFLGPSATGPFAFT